MKDTTRQALVHGLVAGFLGYAVVAVFYAIYDLAVGRLLGTTPELLGLALLGRPAVAGAVIDPAPIAVYNGLHLLVFLAAGIVAAWMVHESEEHPALWYPLLFLGVFVFFHLFGAVAAFAAPVGDQIPTWTVLVAGLLSVGAMALWLWRTHPGLGERVRRAGDLEDGTGSGLPTR